MEETGCEVICGAPNDPHDKGVGDGEGEGTRCRRHLACQHALAREGRKMSMSVSRSTCSVPHLLHI